MGEIITAVMSGCITLLGVLLSNRAAQAVTDEKLAELAQDTFFPRLEKVIGLTKAARGAALTWRMGTPG